MNKRIFEQARKNYITNHPIYGGCSECLFSDQFFMNLLAVNKEVREKTQRISCYDPGDSSCAFHAKVYNQIFGFEFPLDRDGGRYRIDCTYYSSRHIDVLHSVEGCGRCLKI